MKQGGQPMQVPCILNISERDESEWKAISNGNPATIIISSLNSLTVTSVNILEIGLRNRFVSFFLKRNPT